MAAKDTAVGVGLIGCGSIATTAHVPALAKLSGMAKLVATADVNLQAAESVAQNFGAKAYSDYRRVLSHSDIDFVILATPEFLHREQTLAAAAAGKHVLCEKPMAPTLEDADSMIAACEQAGVKLTVGHSRRATERYLLAKRIVEQGDIGEVRLFRENERRQRPAFGEKGIYWKPTHWTGDPERSVGVALTNAIHETDLFSWFIRAEPVSVYAESRTARDGNLVPDFISIVVKYDNGAVAASEVNNSAPPSYPAYHQLEVYGTRGWVTSEDMDQQALTLFRDEGATSPAVVNRLLRFDDAYVAQIAHMVRSVRDDLPLTVVPQEARRALKIALAAVTSSEEHRVVSFQPGEQVGAS